MVKRSKKLDKIFSNIFEIDFYYVDDILSTKADYYTISEKTRAEDAVSAGIRLSAIAKKKNKPIYEVECYGGDFSAYFINDIKSIEKILLKKLKEAKLNESVEEELNKKPNMF